MWRNRFATAFLISFWLLTPDLLCLIPGIEMTQEEHECCEQMGSDCGKIPMPDMHSCCRAPSPSHAVLVARTTDYPELQAMIPVIIPDFDLPHISPQSFHGWFDN